MAETEYQRTPRAYEEMMSLINALDTPLDGNVFRDISGQLWNLWKKTMIDAGYTDVQVELAKGRFKDLASRLDASDADMRNISVNWINKNLGKLDGTFFSDEFMNDLNNGSINFTSLLDKSITWSKYAPSSISAGAISGNFGIVPLTTTFMKESTNRAVSPTLNLAKGDVIIGLPGASFGLETSGGESKTSGWINSIVIDEDGSYKIRARFNDDRLVDGQLDLLAIHFYINNGNTGIRRAELDNLLSGVEPLKFEQGSLNDKGVIEFQSETRISAQEVSFKAGESVELMDTDNYKMAIFEEGANTFLDGWNSIQYISGKDHKVGVMIAKKTDTFIPIHEGNSVVKYKTSKAVLRAADKTAAKYVALNGDDSNDGNSITSAYATLQRALDSGADTIYIERGIYYKQTATKLNIDKVTILPFGEEVYDWGNEKPRQLVEFRGADKLTGQQVYNSIHRFPYTQPNDYFQRVFISKNLPIINNSDPAKPTYNAILWEGNNGESDYKMKPVLTLAECEAEKGTFFYDGSHIYVNCENINNEFNATSIQDGIKLSGKDIKIVDVKADFYYRNTLDLDSIEKLKAINCHANHSGSADGFSLDYTNGELLNSSGIKNRNDGFNMHYFGETVFTNCKGINNYDDGISHHNYCNGFISGGEWRGNGKGGISPVNFSEVNVVGAVIKDNSWAVWNNIDSDVTTTFSGCLFENNDNFVHNTHGGTTRIINSAKYNTGSNTLENGSKVTEY